MGRLGTCLSGFVSCPNGLSEDERGLRDFISRIQFPRALTEIVLVGEPPKKYLGFHMNQVCDRPSIPTYSALTGSSITKTDVVQKMVVRLAKEVAKKMQ
jgi:hypothetical protein